MSLKDYDNGNYTKEYDDPVIKYLRSIIQRYFQIENEISQETKESIIIQAYTRLKEFINAYDTRYIISINGRSGAIDLLIRDFGGEPAFDKNTAFNKDFCDIINKEVTIYNDTNITYTQYGKNQENHIVEGNDDRLYDARVPLAHIHVIDEIVGLKEILDNYDGGGYIHGHSNLTILEALRYTGSRTEIDLAILELLYEKVNTTIDSLTEQDEYFMNTAQRFLNQFAHIFDAILARLAYVKSQLDSWINDFVEKSNKYSDESNVMFRKTLSEILKGYLSKSEYAILEQMLLNSITLVDEKILNFNPAFKIDNYEKVLTKKTSKKYLGRNVDYDVYEGYTKFTLNSRTAYKVTDNNVLSNFHNASILNADCKLYFEYTKDGVSYKDELPHVYQINNSKHDCILIYGNVDSENRINIYTRRIGILPVYLLNQIVFQSWCRDRELNYKEAFLCTNNQDTEFKIINETPQNYESVQYTAHSDQILYKGETFGLTVTKYQTYTEDNNPSEIINKLSVDGHDGDLVDIGSHHAFIRYMKKIDGEWYCLNQFLDKFSSDNQKLMVRAFQTYSTLYKDIWGGTVTDDSITTPIAAPNENLDYVYYYCKNKLLIDPLHRSEYWQLKDNGTLVNEIEDAVAFSNIEKASSSMICTNTGYNFYRLKCTLTVTQIESMKDKSIGVVVALSSGKVLDAYYGSNYTGRLGSELLMSAGTDDPNPEYLWDNANNLFKGGDHFTFRYVALIINAGQEYGATENGYGMELICNYSVNDYSDLNRIAKAVYPKFDWQPGTKISLDIRLDELKLVVYASDPYTMSGDYTSCDYNKIKSEPIMVVPRTYIADNLQSNGPWGVGFMNTQPHAAVTGIKFEAYSTAGSPLTDWFDNATDNKSPNAPMIKAKCTNDDTDPTFNLYYDSYEICTEWTDFYTEQEYRIDIQDWMDWEDVGLNTTISHDNPTMSFGTSITSFSGIEISTVGNVNYGINIGLLSSQGGQWFGPFIKSLTSSYNPIEISSNPAVLNQDAHTGHIFATFEKQNKNNHTIYFCDNTHKDTYNNIIQYLAEYNCELAKHNSNSEKYINASLLLRDDRDYIQFFINDNKMINYYTMADPGEISILEPNDLLSEEYYCGQWDYGENLHTYFPDGKIRYQLFKVPHKGEE